MYCSSCGVAVTQGLTYCNYCGAKLSGKGDNLNESSELRPASLLFAMMATFIFGLVAITLMMGMMKSILDLPVERVLAVALLPFVIMLLLEGVFIRLLFSRKRGTGEERDTLKGQATKELEAAHARGLPEPAASVTEHTTRAFDPIYTERRSK